MQIEVFKFSKRSNSTKAPTSGTTITDVYLKDSTSKYNPSFVLTNFDRDFTYLKWENRYYYITDVISLKNNLDQVVCKIDVLATYKSNILNSQAFVLYSTATYDTDIPDTRLSTSKNVVINSSSGTIYNNSGGCYFVSWLGYGSNSTSQRAVGLISTGRSGFSGLQGILMSNSLLAINFDNIEDTLQKKLANINDCILQCHYLPISFSTSGNGSIVLGSSDLNYATGIDIGSVSHDVTDSATIAIPYNYNDFRNRSQYSSLCIYLPGYGVSPLNIDDFNGQSSLTVNASLDQYSGALTYRIGDRYKFDCNIAIQARLNTSSSGNLGGAITSALGIGTSLATGNVTSGIASTFNAIGSLMDSNHGSVGSFGGSASWLVNGNKIVLTVTSHNTSVDPSSVSTIQGRPLNKVITIPSSGYVQTANASVSCDNENLSNEVNNFLNGGVYIE